MPDALKVHGTKCIVDALVPEELVTWRNASIYGNGMIKELRDTVTRLCEVAAQKDRAHKVLVDEIWEQSSHETQEALARCQMP